MMYAVYIAGRGGEYQTNVQADSPAAAAEKARLFMLERFWKGPKPRSGDTVRVCEIYGEQRDVMIVVP